MHYVDFKQTENVDWSEPLKLHILETLGDDPDKYLQEIQTLNRLRQDCAGIGADALGRDTLYKYFGQLELLELRFPVNDQNVKVSFKW